MGQKSITELFEQGSVILPSSEIEAVARPWYSLPGCKGVFLKDLVTGKETAGAFSYHVVRIWKDCEVSDHNHETQWEWNQIISGKGTFVIGDKEVTPLTAGQTFVTPPQVNHTVSAHDEDLSLLALFVPALV